MDVPPPHRGDGFFVRLARLLWARPTILVVGLAAGLVLGLNLAPEAMSPPTPQAQPSPVHAAAPAASFAPTAPATAPAASATATPAMPDLQPQPALATGSGGAVTVGVFGDSLADGVWMGLYRELRPQRNVGVLRLSQVSTGLTRYAYVDVQARTVDQLAAHHVDIAVIMFGANDEQGIADAGRVYPFGSEGWRAVYGRRVDLLVETLRRQGAAVYWMGLPKMQNAQYDAGATMINTVLKQHMTALGATFVPTVPLTVDAQGQYAAYLPESASGGGSDKRLMRANDGIHMSIAGYRRIAAPVAELIRRELAASAPAAAQAPVTEPVTAPGPVAIAAHAPDAQP